MINPTTARRPSDLKLMTRNLLRCQNWGLAGACKKRIFKICLNQNWKLRRPGALTSAVCTKPFLLFRNNHDGEGIWTDGVQFNCYCTHESVNVN
jgi:hypothetical protein